MATYEKLMVNIRLAELSGLANRMADYYDGQDLSLYEDYAAFVSEFKGLAADLSKALDQDRVYSELAEYDEARMLPFRSIYLLLRGYLLLPDEPQHASAVVMMNCFQKYGMETVRMSFDGKSGNLESYITDLLEPAMQAHIANLPGLEIAVARLQTAQDAFAEQQLQYNRAYSQQRMYKSTASSIKPQILEVLNAKIVDYHRLLASQQNEAFVQMAGTIDSMIVGENALTKARNAAHRAQVERQKAVERERAAAEEENTKDS